MAQDGSEGATCPVEGAAFRFVESNGIRMRIAEIGEGPLVLLAHGWPESWFSWRHQMIGGADEAALRLGMATSVADLRQVVLIPEVGHWVQQEAPAETSAALLEFLESL